ncbi:similar to Saccharomyces cerevisiae YOL026C MIM1 Mitochondrial outer membrane protein [Maudiozyma saulgeensis]|uniref:Similar to Saccharomyces cerevisiae YOL026C MIM1 Mitochondrial outer membrane protein n=1 Tax=Maudiozyma saulgeensis TaxID=1789683 RepID=A0A1X7R2X0_9SACH|nr:similar to Saccharomyces cerevisiae YOL026C MIM1 Mitochondrial outer membrane protein [Kazachstania saulgeensis]
MDRESEMSEGMDDNFSEIQLQSLKFAMNSNNTTDIVPDRNSDNESVEEESALSHTDTTFDLSHITRVLVSSSVNLLLPFINGMMLGFGELVAHELCWRYNWLDRRNVVAFKIYPESRKYAGLTNKNNLSNVL